MKRTILVIEELPASGASPSGAVDTIELTWEQRCKPRYRTVTTSGAEVALSLPRGLQLQDGTLIYNSAEASIIVKAKPEALVAIHPADIDEGCRVAHHLGNWHRCMEVQGGVIYAQPDSPLIDWLKHHSIRHEQCSRPFNPTLRSQGHD